MKWGVPVFLFLSLIPNNLAAKIDHDLEKMVDRKVEATVEYMLTAMNMAGVDDSASRIDSLEYTFIRFEEKIDDLNNKLAEKQTESDKLTERIKIEQEQVKSLTESQNKNLEKISKLQIFQDVAQARFAKIEGQFDEISATEPGPVINQQPVPSQSVNNELSEIQDNVAKLKIVQQVIQTKQSSMIKQIESNLANTTKKEEVLMLAYVSLDVAFAGVREELESLEHISGVNTTELQEANKEQSKNIAQLQIFQDLVVAKFGKIANDSSKLQMVEAKVDSVDVKVSKIRDAFENQVIPALQSVFEDKVVEDTTAGMRTESTVEETTRKEQTTRPVYRFTTYDNLITTRAETTKKIETTRISEDTTTPIPTPGGWSTPANTEAPIPTPIGWTTPGVITPADEDGSGHKDHSGDTTTRISAIEEEEIKIVTEKDWSTPGETEAAPIVTQKGYSTPGDITEAGPIVTQKGYSTPGDITTEENGSGSS